MLIIDKFLEAIAENAVVVVQFNSQNSVAVHIYPHLRFLTYLLRFALVLRYRLNTQSISCCDLMLRVLAVEAV